MSGNFKCFVGSFVQPTSTGNQSVTGVGFQPKVVIFFNNSRTSDGVGSKAQLYYGWAVDSTHRAAEAFSSDDAVVTSLSGEVYSTSRCIFASNSSGSSTTVADLVSMDSDGFTLNWSTADSTARIINYLALGGSDITNATSGSFNSEAASGNKAYTGLGFQPTLVLFMMNVGSGSAPGRFGMGAAVSSSKRAAIAFESNSGANPSRTRRENDRARCTEVTVNGNFPYIGADFISMDSDGFTLNWNTVRADTRSVKYLAIKGGRVTIKQFQPPVSIGNEPKTGFGFQPSGILVFSAQGNGTSGFDGMRGLIGASSGSTSRACCWMGDQNGVSPTVAKHDLDRTKVIKMQTEASTPTLTDVADLVSFDVDGLTWNWSTATGSADYYVIAFGSSSYSQSMVVPVTYGTSIFNRSLSRYLSVSVQNNVSIVRSISRSFSVQVQYLSSISRSISRLLNTVQFSVLSTLSNSITRVAKVFTSRSRTSTVTSEVRNTTFTSESRGGDTTFTPGSGSGVS